MERFGKIRFSDLKSENSLGGRPGRFCRLNERQSTFLLTLLRNTEPVVEFKFRLTNECYKQRRFILERQTAQWQQLRLTGKQTRADETDIILTKLIPLAISQGSEHPERLYMVYSRLVNTVMAVSYTHLDV